MFSANAKGQADEDVSMLLYRASGAEVISREIALSVATMVFKRIFGEENFDSQLPLQISDGGDRWVIEGSRRADDRTPPDGQPTKGNVEIVILKINCQIVKLIQNSYFPITGPRK